MKTKSYYNRSVFSVFLTALALVTLLTLQSTRATTLTVQVNDNFNSTPLGTPVASPTPSPGHTVTTQTYVGLTGAGATAAIANNGTSFGGTNFLSITQSGAGTGETVGFQVNSADAITSGMAYYSFSFSVSNLTGTNFFMGVCNTNGPSTTGNFVSDLILSNHTLTVYQYGASMGNVTISSSIAANTQYKVQEIFNFSSQLVTVNLFNASNTQVGSATGTFNGSGTGTGKIGGTAFTTQNGTTGSVLQVDNVYLTTVPEPGVTAFLGITGMAFMCFYTLRRQRNSGKSFHVK